MSVLRWDVKDEGQIRSSRTGNQEIVDELVIITSDVADTLSVIKRDIPELQRWQPHPSEPGFFVDEFSAKQEKGSPIWNASVRYVDGLPDSPLDLPAVMTVRTETLPGATILNRDGQLILNTAGDVVQPIDKPERIRIFTFTKNLPSVAEWLFDLEDVVNSGSIRIAGKPREPRTMLLRKIEFGAPQTDNEVTFVPCTVELAYRKSTWIYKYPSVGFNQLVTERERFGSSAAIAGASVTRKRPILINAQAPSEPQLLDADGKWIEKPEPADLVILEEHLYSEADLSVLPLE